MCLLFVVAVVAVYAQELDPAKVLEKRAQLEAELQALDAQIGGFTSLIQGKQKEATSLERDIAILDAQIDRARLEIRARTLRIENLVNAIDDKTNAIGGLVIKMEKEKNSLSELLRKQYEIDQTSLIEIVLTYDNFSDFFVDADSFDTIQASLQQSFEDIVDTKVITENERDELENRKAEEVQLRTTQELERARIEEREAEKKRLLAATKGQEAEYQKLLSSRQKDAATIRSQLFLLTGSPDIPFEKAVEYANVAWRATGVRPAFLLGVIAEESNLGANVGTGNWQIDLSHSRCAKQRTAFQQITAELGLDPDLMPVSKKAWYGYCGGAMGPAQFIPTTWLLFKDKVASITGHNPPNPWDPLDAFVASALYLKDSGAAAGGYEAEREAALRYLAGGNWWKPSYAFYGDDVMALAKKYQDQIDILQGS